MSKQFHFQFLGKTIPAARPRSTIRGGKIVTYTAKKSRDFQATLTGQLFVAARQQNWKPIAGPIVVCLWFFLPHALENKPIYPARKPDIDNLAKAVLDCGTRAALWHDDCQIVRLTLGKDWQRDRKIDYPGFDLTVDNISEGR